MTTSPLLNQDIKTDETSVEFTLHVNDNVPLSEVVKDNVPLSEVVVLPLKCSS